MRVKYYPIFTRLRRNDRFGIAPRVHQVRLFEAALLSCRSKDCAGLVSERLGGLLPCDWSASRLPNLYYIMKPTGQEHLY